MSRPFSPRGKRHWLEDSLDDLEGPAFLVTVGGVAAAFGGYEIWDYYDKALLCWGMAHPRFHGHGSGPLAAGRPAGAHRRGNAADEVGHRRYVAEDRTFLPQPRLRDGERLAQGYRTGGDMHVLRFDLAATNGEALKQRSANSFRAAQARCG